MGKRYPKPQAFKKDLKERQYQPFVCLAEMGIKKKTVSEFSGVFDPVKQTKRQENITCIYKIYVFINSHVMVRSESLEQLLSFTVAHSTFNPYLVKRRPIEDQHGLS